MEEPVDVQVAGATAASVVRAGDRETENDSVGGLLLVAATRSCTNGFVNPSNRMVTDADPPHPRVVDRLRRLPGAGRHSPGRPRRRGAPRAESAHAPDRTGRAAQDA